VTAELRDVIRDTVRNLEGLRAQMRELMTELQERRAPLLQMLEEWKAEHERLWREQRRGGSGGAER
jgi:hypothetical protein